MAIKNSVDKTGNTYVDSSGVERYKGSNNRVTSSSGSSSNSSSGSSSVSSVTTPSNVSSADNVGTNYGKGGTSENRETMYDFSNKATGEKKTHYSNYTNYEDAMREAGLGDDWKLDTAVTYRKPSKSRDPYVSNTSDGGFADVALKQMQAADYLYGANADQLDESTRAILQGIIDGSVSSAGVNFGNATNYGGLLNGSTSKGTYDNIDLGYLEGLLANNTRVPQQTNDMLTTAELQTFANGYTPNQLADGTIFGASSNPYASNPNYVNPYYNNANFNVNGAYNSYDIPAYTGLTKDEISAIYGDIFGTQEQMAANNLAFLESIADMQRDDTNSAYDKAAEQAYVQSMLDQRNLPQLLKAQGISGGAAESSNLAQQLNYENIVNANETDRANALREIDLNLLTAQNDINTNLAQTQATLQQDMLGALQTAATYENEYNRWVTEYINAQNMADREYAMQMAEIARQAQAEEEERAWQTALLASEYGDYSLLNALGINTNSTTTPRSVTTNPTNPNPTGDGNLFGDDKTETDANIEVAETEMSGFGNDADGQKAKANYLAQRLWVEALTVDEFATLLERNNLSTSDVAPYLTAEQWEIIENR